MKRIVLFYLFLLMVINTDTLHAQNDSFVFTTNKFSPYFPAYLGNGHFSIATSVSGTLPAESYMIKFYDHGEEDIPRIANLPAWNEINYSGGSTWLNNSLSDTASFKNYTQKLDMYSGTLETSFNWMENNRSSRINVMSFVSRANNNLAVIRLEVETDFAGVVKIAFPFNEREELKRKPFAKLEKADPNPPGKWPAEWYPGFTEVIRAVASYADNNAAIRAISRTAGKHTKIAHAIDVYYDGTLNNIKVTPTSADKAANIEIEFNAEKNKRYTFYKVVSVFSGNEADNELINKAAKNTDEAKKSGFDKLLSDHKAEWSRIWQTDIVVEGDKEYQKIIHSMMYYLLCSIDDNTAFSIPPMGLASSGYYGHIFWDADTYMLPPLLFMHPSFAKSMVDFRYNCLPAAKENAVKNNYKGAMFPWESDEEGNETTPFFAYQNAIKENHIVADVALGQWQYFLATKDTAWLKTRGADIILATAEFWESRVHFNPDKDRYEIGKVVSVSEGLTDVSNETYTNSIAKLNLQIAAKVNSILGKPVNTKWKEISDKMLIPLDVENQYHPIHENAPAATAGNEDFWKSVAPLLAFPLQIEMSDTVKRNDLVHAISSLVKDGPGANMGINFLAIVAAEFEDDSLFNLTIDKTVKGFLRSPYNVLAETHTNNSINFITGAGAFLQQVIFGYTGLRLTDEGMVQKYKPRLPRNITSLTLKNFTVNNKKYDIVVQSGKLEMKLFDD